MIINTTTDSEIEERPLRAEEVMVINAIMEQQTINMEAKEYLARTDWYEIRAISGKPVPEDILQKRQEARDSITDE